MGVGPGAPGGVRSSMQIALCNGLGMGLLLKHASMAASLASWCNFQPKCAPQLVVYSIAGSSQRAQLLK
jgi:hypothetical protein